MNEPTASVRLLVMLLALAPLGACAAAPERAATEQAPTKQAANEPAPAKKSAPARKKTFTKSECAPDGPFCWLVRDHARWTYDDLSRDELAKVHHAHSQEFGACFERHMDELRAIKDSSQQRVRISYTVGPDGQVSNKLVRVYDTNGSPTDQAPLVAQCLERVVASFDYEVAPEDQHQVVLPLEYFAQKRQMRLYLPVAGVGSLDKEKIRQVIRSHRMAIAMCYERELLEHKGLQGRTKVRFVIQANGHVSNSETTSSTLDAPTVEACVNREIETWQFPEPEGGGIVVVNYPFNFSRQ